MKDILAVCMDHTHLLKDSEGRCYDLSKYEFKTRNDLEEELIKFKEIFKTVNKDRTVVILSELLTPYINGLGIEPQWWYKLISDIALETRDQINPVELVHNRGTILFRCSSCGNRIPPRFGLWTHLECYRCTVKHDTTDNILRNIVREYRLAHSFTRGREDIHESNAPPFHQVFWDLVNVKELKYRGPYRTTTDEKTILFLVEMDRACRFIREAIVSSCRDREEKPLQLDPRGWIDQWADKHGEFSKFKKIRGATLASKSISNTISSICALINRTQKLPNLEDPLWISYWTQVTVDPSSKRISLPRTRERYLQLSNDAEIPNVPYFVEVEIAKNKELQTRFVLSGKSKPKVLPIDENAYIRGKNRHNTRRGRGKFISQIN